MPKKALVWLSGWVDSAVAAYLLKQQGYEVSAGFMINYLTPDDSCPTRIDLAAAKEVAEYLKIPFFTFDFIEEYEKRVLQYIFEWYTKGLTPNPDVFCNTWIKFDLFREEALASWFDYVATGHYARISEQVQSTKDKVQNGRIDNTEELSLLRGRDPDKDQSYFLSALTSSQLEHALFPIGHLLKSEVRDIAREAGLPNAERKDSQGLCFVGKVNFSEFLKEHIASKRGNILDIHGNIIGEHDGAFQYTIGQRKGIAVWGWPALYVLEKDVQHNTITVGEENDPRLFRDSCFLTDMNWLADVSPPIKCEAQVRYRQKAQKCVIREHGAQSTEHKGEIEVSFNDPIRAITPGQICALYDGDRVLGSGIIQ